MSSPTRSPAGSRLLVPAAGALLFGGGVALALLWAPGDVDQGLSQRIFYLHVPIALTAYGLFVVAAWKAYRLLATRDERYDLESYTAVHLGVVFATMTLLTGSIWARASWGVWWSWSERQLVLFLLLFLFYASYFVLRSSVDEGIGRATICAVYALFGVVLIPVGLLAIRLAENFIHPVVFSRDGPQMAGEMFLAFCVCLAGTAALAAALYGNELLGKRLDAELRELRELRELGEAS